MKHLALRFLVFAWLLLAVTGCQQTTPPSSEQAGSLAQVESNQKMTVTHDGRPTTAPMTREVRESTPEETAMLDKVSETLTEETAEGFHERGTLYLMVGEEAGITEAYERAAQDFTRSIELDPKLLGAYNNRAMAYIRIGDAEAALADFDRGLALEPGQADLHMRRASVLSKLGRDQDAIESYDVAVELGQVDAAFNRGNAHLRLGQEDLAKRDYLLVIEKSQQPQLVEAAKMNLESLE